MAHFAELDENNKVVNVIRVENDVITDENEKEQESIGIDFCESLYGHRRFVQTSYNNNFRGNYAPIDGFYLPEEDVFVGLKPYDSWVLSDDAQWVAPIPYPNVEGVIHIWNEENKSWNLITE